MNNQMGSFRLRPSVKTLLRVLLALGLLVLLFQFVEPESLRAAFARARGDLIGLATGLLVFNLGFQVLKWRRLLKDSGLAFPDALIARSLLFGISIGTLTPGQLGEFGGRAVLLQTDRERVVGLTIVDKLQILGIMAIGGLPAIAILLRFGIVPGVLMAAAATLVGVVLVRPAVCSEWIRERLFRNTGSKWISEFFQAARTLQNSGTIMGTTVLTVAFYLVLWIQIHVLLNAFVDVSAADSFLGFAATMFAKSFFPFTFADLGVREIGLVYFLSIRGIPEEAALSASLLLFAINILVPSIIGLMFIPDSLSARAEA